MKGHQSGVAEVEVEVEVEVVVPVEVGVEGALGRVGQEEASPMDASHLPQWQFSTR